MTDVETEKENSTQKYFFHKIYDKYLNLNQVWSNFQQKKSMYSNTKLTEKKWKRK